MWCVGLTLLNIPPLPPKKKIVLQDAATKALLFYFLNKAFPYSLDHL